MALSVILLIGCNQPSGETSHQPQATYEPIAFASPQPRIVPGLNVVAIPPVEALERAPTPTPTPLPIQENVSATAVEPELSLPPELEEQARIIDAYLVGTPLAGQGPAMVAAAAKYGIDYRMLPAISLYESTWGRNACGHNPYGYDSCGTTWDTWEEAHEVAARTLAGYGGMTLTKLQIWNRGNVNDPAGYNYAIKVIREMRTIGP